MGEYVYFSNTTKGNKHREQNKNKDKETRDGHFYRFENLTLVPFDRRGILKNILTSEEIQLLNDYHQRVYDELESELNIEEKRFLRKMTRPL